MALRAQHRSKFAALVRLWWRLDVREKLYSGTKNSKQTYKLQIHGILLLIYINTYKSVEINLMSPDYINQENLKLNYPEFWINYICKYK